MKKICKDRAVFIYKFFIPMISLRKVFSFIKSGGVDFVDLRFCDLRGVWQHMTIPGHAFNQKEIEKGYGFDGSSIRGFQSIYESDMLLKPDIDTLFLDPFFEKTASVICDIYDPDTKGRFEKDPRWIAKKAEHYVIKSGVGDISYWGPELEFFVFEKIEYVLTPHLSKISIIDPEFGEASIETNDGYPIAAKAGYFPVPPQDKFQTFRSEMVRILETIGVAIEVHHHEVATGGQAEIDMRYDSLTKMADKVMIYKYVARNLAKKYGMTACFLPKPIYGDNGSGMHTHQSIFKKGKNIFYDPAGYGELSKQALNYIAGLLSNVVALLGITNPTVNSYRRLVPHFEAPTSIAYSKRNRSAAIRIPMYFSKDEKSKRIEFRCPDPACNPYLSFAAQLVSGIEGIKEKSNPNTLGFGPFDENIWENKSIKQTPNSLFETLAALKKDRILIKSGVFSKELIESYLSVKEEEATQSLLYPTPADFWFYGDI